jgi:hypothetical protein
MAEHGSAVQPGDVIRDLREPRAGLFCRGGRPESASSSFKCWLRSSVNDQQAILGGKSATGTNWDFNGGTVLLLGPSSTVLGEKV